MLAIRMQRTGRKGHAMFRVVVQDSRRTPTSGKFVAQIGSYDPHTKTAQLAKDKASFYLEHGAQPSDRVARLLKKEGVKLPTWVSLEAKKTGVVRNAEKLRKNQPAVEKVEETEVVTAEVAETPEEVTETKAVVAETTAEEIEAAPEVVAEPVVEEAPKEPAEAEASVEADEKTTKE